MFKTFTIKKKDSKLDKMNKTKNIYSAELYEEALQISPSPSTPPMMNFSGLWPSCYMLGKCQIYPQKVAIFTLRNFEDVEDYGT